MEYTILATINLNHEYFHSFDSAGLEIVIPNETIKIFRNYRLQLKKRNNQFVLITESKNDQLLIPIQKIGFQLYINSTNKTFLNYTNLPFQNPAAGIYYFTNNQNKPNLTNQNPCAISNYLEIYNNQIHLNNTNSTHVHLTDIENNTVECHISKTNNEVTLTPVNPSNNPVYISDKENLIGGFIQKTMLNIQHFALLNIEFENINLIANYEPHKLALCFSQRELYWRYKIIQKNRTYQKLTIVDNDKRIQFNEAESNNGETQTSIFTSNAAIACTKASKIHLDLIESDTNGDNVLISKLPVPPINNINAYNGQELNTFVIEKFVYI